MTAPTAPPQQREAAATPDIAGWARRAATAVAIPIGSVILAFLIGAVIFAWAVQLLITLLYAMDVALTGV